MSESTPKLNEALSKAQAEMPHVSFDATNPFLKNRYASLGAVIQASKEVLAKHGLAVEQMPISEGGCIGVRTTLRHSSGESTSGTLCLPLAEERGKSQAQVAGSIITYLRRYAWASVLGMYADEDTDGNDAGNAPKAPQKPAATQSPVPTFKTPPAPSSAQEMVVTAVVKDVREATGTAKGKPWKAYFVQFEDGTEAGTFSDTIGNNAKSFIGQRALVKLKPGKREGTLELVSIEPADITP